MKKLLALLVAVIVLATVTSVGIGADDEKAKVKKPKVIPSKAEMLRGKVNQPGYKDLDPEAMKKRYKDKYQKQLENAKAEPQALVTKLNAIKAVAEKENAKDTIAMLNKLIASTEEQMQKKVTALEARQAKFKEMMELRDQTQEKKPGKPKREKLDEAEPKVKDVVTE